MRSSRFLILILGMALGCTSPDGGRSDSGGDVTLIVNADILTMASDQPSAEAIVLRGDRILAIGSEAEVRAAAPEHDRFFDMDGRTIVPGFFESHDHLYMSSSTALIADISPFSTPTLAEALEKLSGVDPDEDGWIVAFGADQTLYEEGRGPTRDVLDPLFPDTPVIVYHLSGHGAFMNGEALRRSGLDESTPDPTGGFYEKDDRGRLTGFLSGQPAFLPYKPYPNASLDAAVKASQFRASKGVTTASELAIMNAFVLDGLAQATEDERFATRVVAGYFSTAPDYEEMYHSFTTMRTTSWRSSSSRPGRTARLREGRPT